MYLVSYDIENDALRLRLAKLLLRYGLHRVQYSVFLGTLEDRLYRELLVALRGHPQNKSWGPQDSVLVIPLHQYSIEQMETIGAWPDRWEEMTGEMHTLLI